MVRELWLEIEEVSSGGAERRVRLRFSSPERAGSAEVAFQSPESTAMRALGRRYVRDFRSWRAKDRDFGLTAERTLLQLGRALGDALVDSNYQLLGFCEEVERIGIASLHVAIAGHSDLPWELLVLPDSAYTVAAASASFVHRDRDRAGEGRVPPGEQPALELALDGHAGMRVLRLDADAHLGGIALAWTRLGWQGALHHRLATSPRDEDTDAWHIVYASVAVQGDAITVDGESCTLQSFVERVRLLGASLLILEPRFDSEPADRVALEALRGGLDNVVIFSEPSALGWPNAWLEILLERIGDGLGLRSAVVETRKRMQRALLEARKGDSEAPHAAQQWHALRHYSQRDVVFFGRSQPRTPFESTEAYGALRASLFGFDSAHLPPVAPELGDGPVLDVFQRLRAERSVCVTAAHGGGLTHTLHRTALFVRANGDADRAFYWNFANDAFTASDVLEMVAGARGETDPTRVTESSVLQPLANQVELFVFDDVDALDAAGLEDVAALATRIAQAGGQCLIGSHTPLTAFAATSHVSLPPLSERDSVALAQATAPAALALGPRVFTLLDALRGHPLLIRRLLATCRQDSLESLVAEAKADDGDRAGALERFHARRWRALPEHLRTLISAWLPFDGLYLQLLMIAVDRPGSARSEPGRELFDRIGVPAADSCASCIERLTAAGFVVTSGAGSVIDRAARRFLDTAVEPDRAGALGLSLAGLVCEGVVRLLSRREQADVLGGHLLQHRALLLRQLETLAGAGQFALAARACLSLTALLVRARASEEASHWPRALLENAGPSACTSDDPVVATMWLGLALRTRLAPLDGVLALGAEHWTAKLRAIAAEPDPAWRALFPLAVTFVERAHDLAGDYERYREVAEFACEQYRASANWPAWAEQLQALAAAEHTLGHADARDRLERELIDGSCYAAFGGAAQLRRRSLAQLFGARLRRADDVAARDALERLEREWDAEDADPLALFLHGELALRSCEWERATELACRVWSAILRGKQRDVEIDAVAQRLRQLEQQLGPERFAEIYAEHAAGTPAPAEFMEDASVRSR